MKPTLWYNNDMKTSKDIVTGDLVGSILISGKEGRVFFGTCQNCEEFRSINANHINAILKGRGKGCHCSRRRSDPMPELSWRFSNYERAAKKRGLTWELRMSDFLDITRENCYYCGAEPEMRPSHAKSWGYKFPMSGIDRMNSSRGYEIDNVVPCCSYCNQAKWDHDVQDFLLWIKRVYSHQFQEVVA